MKLEHVAIWTAQLERLKTFYETWFDGVSNELYVNEAKSFRSYFLRFGDGARLELMSKPTIPANLNDTIEAQHLGIIHLAFEMGSMDAVDRKAAQMRSAGLPVLSGPRKTGDGYYEFETLDPDGNRLEVTALWKERE